MADTPLKDPAFVALKLIEDAENLRCWLPRGSYRVFSDLEWAIEHLRDAAKVHVLLDELGVPRTALLDGREITLNLANRVLTLSQKNTQEVW